MYDDLLNTAEAVWRHAAAKLIFIKHYENGDRSLQADIYQEGASFRVDTLDTSWNHISRQPQPTQAAAERFARGFVSEVKS